MTAQLIIRLFGLEDLTKALDRDMRPKYCLTYMKKEFNISDSSNGSRKRACLRLECVSESRWPGPRSATGWMDWDLRQFIVSPKVSEFGLLFLFWEFHLLALTKISHRYSAADILLLVRMNCVLSWFSISRSLVLVPQLLDTHPI